jgi:metal-responsive CopG/Arc/MetJ family transcriptional regulator
MVKGVDNMSDQKHTGEATFQVHVDKQLLKDFDKAIKKNGYKNRADWLREKMREEIKRS